MPVILTLLAGTDILALIANHLERGGKSVQIAWKGGEKSAPNIPFEIPQGKLTPSTAQ